MRIGIPAETMQREATPETVKRLDRAGHEIQVQSGSGVAASVTDVAFEAAGATLTDTAGAFGAEIVLSRRRWARW